MLPDPDGKRVGSGGATFHVMKYLSEQGGGADFFRGKRILGDSLRRGLQAGTPVFGLRKIIFTGAAGAAGRTAFHPV